MGSSGAGALRYAREAIFGYVDLNSEILGLDKTVSSQAIGGRNCTSRLDSPSEDTNYGHSKPRRDPSSALPAMLWPRAQGFQHVGS